jgi:hypothetical protein
MPIKTADVYISCPPVSDPAEQIRTATGQSPNALVTSARSKPRASSAAWGLANLIFSRDFQTARQTGADAAMWLWKEEQALRVPVEPECCRWAGVAGWGTWTLGNHALAPSEALISLLYSGPHQKIGQGCGKSHRTACGQNRRCGNGFPQVSLR